MQHQVQPAWNGGQGGGGKGGIDMGGGGGGGGGCAGGACSGCFGACGADGPGVMTYVGEGGSYVAEATYRYVGGNNGEFTVVKPAPSRGYCWLGALGFILLALLGILIWLLVDSRATTTTQDLGDPDILPDVDGSTTCVIWGDPHIIGWDGAQSNWYDEGDFWIASNEFLSIQGRYKATPFTHGLAATEQIAIGGQALGGSTLIVGEMQNGKITCNGNEILTASFPATAQCGNAAIEYNDRGGAVDQDFVKVAAEQQLATRIVHIKIATTAGDVVLQVMRWPNHINAKIIMPTTFPVDGTCGTNNGNPADDNAAAISQRSKATVPVTQKLFPDQFVPVASSSPQKTLADCDQTTQASARAACASKAQELDNGQGTQFEMESCIFDTCFGGAEFAAEDEIAFNVLN